MKKIIFILVFFIVSNYSFLTNECQSQWEEMSNGISDGHISCFAVLGTNIFAATGGGMVISTNNGSVWTPIINGFTNVNVLSLAVLGTNIFAGTMGSLVYLTSNNGAIWIPTSLHQYILSFAVSGNNIFAGSDNFGVWLSSNNGVNWTQTSLNNRTVTSLAVYGNNIFAGTNGPGVYRSTNNGANWTQTSLNNRRIRAIAIRDSEHVYAGTDSNGVYLSTNSGVNWNQIGFNNSILYSLGLSGNYIFVGILDSGIYLSSNNGTNWIQKNQGFGVIPTVNTFLFTNNYIFAGTNGLSIWRRSYSETIGIQNISSEIPTSFSLGQNYPNPFNPSTSIKFAIASSPLVPLQRGNLVKIVVYDVMGREVETLVNERLQAGSYEVTFDGSGLNSGVYFYRIETENYTETKRMMLLK